MDLHDAIEYICSMDAEIPVISVLLDSYQKKFQKNLSDLLEREASLRAIHKLNKTQYKDFAIDALSDVNN